MPAQAEDSGVTIYPMGVTGIQRIPIILYGGGVAKGSAKTVTGSTIEHESGGGGLR